MVPIVTSHLYPVSRRTQSAFIQPISRNTDLITLKLHPTFVAMIQKQLVLGVWLSFPKAVEVKALDNIGSGCISLYIQMEIKTGVHVHFFD